MIVWGNHSATQYPDVDHATVGDSSIKEQISDDWLKSDFIPAIQQRGAEIIKARGASSAASAASAAIDHVRDWVLGTNDRWTTMGVPSDGSYGIPEGVIYGFPTTCANGDYQIIPDLNIDDFSRSKMNTTLEELEGERDAVAHLLK